MSDKNDNDKKHNAKHFPFKSPYANLASAIIRSGIQAHDTRFLESDWCDTLRLICRMDDEMHGGARASMIVGTTSSHNIKE